MTTITSRVRPSKRRRRVSGTQLAVYFVSLLLVSLILAPVAYIILGGFRSNADITVDPAGLPATWHPENYVNVLKSGVFWQEVGNSTIAAVATTVVVVALGVMAAYVLARYPFKGRGLMYAVFASGLMFPMTVAITPLYLMVRGIGLMNSLPGIIVPQIAFQMSITVIILVPFLQALPRELEEAAFIDGCSRLGYFWRMVIPLSKPAVITVGILAFIASWNSYMLPLFILSSEDNFTLPLGVQALSLIHI